MVATHAISKPLSAALSLTTGVLRKLCAEVDGCPSSKRRPPSSFRFAASRLARRFATTHKPANAFAAKPAPLRALNHPNICTSMMRSARRPSFMVLECLARPNSQHIITASPWIGSTPRVRHRSADPLDPLHSEDRPSRHQARQHFPSLSAAMPSFLEFRLAKVARPIVPSDFRWANSTVGAADADLTSPGTVWQPLPTWFSRTSPLQGTRRTHRHFFLGRRR